MKKNQITSAGFNNSTLSIPEIEAEIKYQDWRRSLEEVTLRKLSESGIQRAFRIVDGNARKCFESGMSPEQVFREDFKI